MDEPHLLKVCMTSCHLLNRADRNSAIHGGGPRLMSLVTGSNPQLSGISRGRQWGRVQPYTQNSPAFSFSDCRQANFLTIIFSSSVSDTKRLSGVFFPRSSLSFYAWSTLMPQQPGLPTHNGRYFNLEPLQGVMPAAIRLRYVCALWQRKPRVKKMV